MPGHRPGQRGFTLVETMLTVLLMAVLLALALPAYQNYRERARVAQAMRDIVMLSAGVQRFAIDNRDLPQTLDQIGAGSYLDPWGRPYRYYNVEANGRGGARKDKRLNPLNTDFDLYSVGPDGLTKPQISQKDSVDDIIRASNGRFVGKAEDY